jgi:Icc-related predicted phosphoesterase
LKPYKIIGCGDVHAEFDLLDQVLKRGYKEDIDLIIFTGDFCDGRKLSENANVSDFLNQIEPIFDIFRSCKIPVFFVLGNHDPLELSMDLQKINSVIDLHNSKIIWNKYSIGGIGGSHYVTPQLLNLTVPFSEGIFPQKIQIDNFEFVKEIQMDDFPFYIHSNVQVLYDHIFPCDIFVSHTPPLLNETDHYSKYSAGIGYLLEKHRPLLALSGHIHKPEIMMEEFEWSDKSKTHLVNLGSLDNNKIFLIDLLGNEKQVIDIKILDL